MSAHSDVNPGPAARRARPRRARLALSFVALALALPAGAARAQVQQNDPNAANASLARQGEIRALNQARTADFNTLNMQIQRDVQYRPAPPGGQLYGLRRSGHRGGGHRGGHSGFNTGVCIGC